MAKTKKISQKLVSRIYDLVKERNRELTLDAGLKASLGIIFSFPVFGFIFWLGWFVFDLQVAAMATAAFLVVSTLAAWYRVDPLAGLERLTDKQLRLTLVSLATPGLVYFSPRHATAGFAFLLLGGPASVLEAFGIWAHRFRVDDSILEEAARVLAACQAEPPADKVSAPNAALLLKRLALIKVVPKGESKALAVTIKGFSVLAGTKADENRPARTPDSAKKPEAENELDP